MANEAFFKQNSSSQSLSDDFKCIHIFVELFNNILIFHFNSYLLNFSLVYLFISHCKLYFIP